MKRMSNSFRMAQQAPLNDKTSFMTTMMYWESIGNAIYEKW